MSGGTTEMSKHRVCSESELEEVGSRVIKEIEGREIALFKLEDGYHAALNYCIHQAGPLCEGKLMGHTVPQDDGWSWGYDDENKYVTCPWHGWKFDLTTGENVDSDEYSVPIYDTAVENGDIYVEL